MDAERLAELRRVADEATAGPWRTWNDAHVGNPDAWMGGICMPTPASNFDQQQPDAEFIAAARTAVPELLDEVERLETDLDGAKAWRNRADDWEATALRYKAERDAAVARADAAEAQEREWRHKYDVLLREHDTATTELAEAVGKVERVREWVKGDGNALVFKVSIRRALDGGV